MKITETSLKRIIREELKRLDEASEPSTLYDYYKSIDEKMPSKLARQTKAKSLGVSSDVVRKIGTAGPAGAKANTVLLKALLKSDKDNSNQAVKDDVDLKPSVPKDVRFGDETADEEEEDEAKEQRTDALKSVLTTPMDKELGGKVNAIIDVMDVNIYGPIAAMVGRANKGKYGLAAKKSAAELSGKKLWLAKTDTLPDFSNGGSPADLARITKTGLGPATGNKWMNKLINNLLLGIESGYGISSHVIVSAFLGRQSQGEQASAKALKAAVLKKYNDIKISAGGTTLKRDNKAKYDRRVRKLVVKEKRNPDSVLNKWEGGEKEVNLLRADAVSVAATIKQASAKLRTLLNDKSENGQKARAILNRTILPTDDAMVRVLLPTGVKYK